MSEPAIASSQDGLSDADVAERVANGQVNITPDPPGRSVGNIIRANLMTPINAIMIVLFALILISGNWRDGLFVGVVVSNTVIGVITEVRARAELAKLQVVTAPRATVVRNGESRTISTDEIVIDDVVELSTGDQAAVDGEIVDSTGLQMDCV
jgi:cation-transporting ATPase E